MFFLGAAVCEIPRAKLVAPSIASLAQARVGSRLGKMPSGDGGESQVGKGAIAVIHPVAATPEKTWRAEGFLAVAERLVARGMEPVFIGAAQDDLAPFRAFRTIAGAPLAEVKTLLAGASFFIGNDSGPAHMAAAFGLPVVVIFGSSNPAIWGPWRTASEVVTANGSIANVSTPQVLSALERLRVHA
jgi:ADP-heptose:LPS heptosyltransferase